MSSPMTTIVKLTDSHGRTRSGLFYAGRRFEKPGVWAWTGKRHVRVLPLARRFAR